MKVYLREVYTIYGKTGNTEISIFEGDIKKDKEYWEKHHNAKVVRYFELREVEKNE